MAETLETMDPESVAYARLLKADIDRYVERRCAPLLARIDALERAAAIAPTVGPAGKDGRDGVDGKDGVTGRDGATGLVGPAGEKGADGIPGERGTDGAAGEPGSQGPAGPAGEKGEPGERGESGPKGEPGERGPAGGPGEKGLPGEPGLDGRDGIEGPPGRDAARLEIGEGIEARRVYRSGSYVTHLGGLWRSLRMTDPIEEGATPEKILAAGWNVLVNGLADMAVFDDGERTVKFALMSTDGRTQVLTKTVPGIVYRNLFIRGEQYKSGDVVTWDGSAWIAGGDTKAEPGTSPDWKLFVRKGRDRGKLGE